MEATGGKSVFSGDFHNDVLCFEGKKKFNLRPHWIKSNTKRGSIVGSKKVRRSSSMLGNLSTKNEASSLRVDLNPGQTEINGIKKLNKIIEQKEDPEDNSEELYIVPGTEGSISPTSPNSPIGTAKMFIQDESEESKTRITGATSQKIKIPS